MNTTQKPVQHPSKVAASERVYSLDALRAVMMLLGIVIHAAITYASIDYGRAWSLKDPNNSLVFDVVVGFIHAFRMPVFFVAAGYFSALLFYKKGPNAMLINRMKRIVLPFLLGVLVTYPLIIFSFTFSKAAFAGAASPAIDAWQFTLSGTWLPLNVAHLWFLYFLAMYAVVGWLLALLFSKLPSFSAAAKRAFSILFQSFWLRLMLMIALYFGCLFWMGGSGILTNNNWKVNPSIFVTYLVFFGAGWMMYNTNSLGNLKGFPILQLSIATALFLVANFITWPNAPWVLMVRQLFTAVYGSLFIFGFIAFFITYFSHYSGWLSYQMDAAYWVYIIHLPIVAFVPGVIAGIALPAVVKFAITFSVTAIICLASYKYLVRGTFIGKFLNGKVYRKKQSQIVNAENEVAMPVTV